MQPARGLRIRNAENLRGLVIAQELDKPPQCGLQRRVS
jgi:hypothetical protein